MDIVSRSFEVFAACVQGFVLLSKAQNLGEDASYLVTMLNVQEYRFLQWAEIVGIDSPDRKIDPRLNHVQASLLMAELRKMLEKDKIRQRYQLELVDREPIQGENVVEGPQDILSSAVSDQRRVDILYRANLIQSRNTLPKRLWWAAVDKNKLEKFVSKVRETVQGLWDLLNPIQQTDMLNTVQQILSRTIDMSNDVKGLLGLRTALERTSGDVEANSAVPLAASARVKAIAVALDSPEQFKQETSPSDTISRIDIVPVKSLQDGLSCIQKTEDATRSVARYRGKPVLIEHKPVPAKYKSKLKHRVVDLATLLSTRTHPAFLTLRCLGFFEDQEGFSLVYDYPDTLDSTFDVTDISQSPPSPISLLDLLRLHEPALQPSLSTRLKLSIQCLHALILLHTAGWLHKSLRSSNFLFFATEASARKNPESVLAHPFLAGFNFSRQDRPAEMSEYLSEDPQADIYRHPSALGEPLVSFGKHMDLYSLGTVLIELAEWRPLNAIVHKCVRVTGGGKDVPVDKIKPVRQWLLRDKVGNGSVAYRVGDEFGGAVAMCLEGESDEEKTRRAVLEQEWAILKKLEACRI